MHPKDFHKIFKEIHQRLKAERNCDKSYLGCSVHQDWQSDDLFQEWITKQVGWNREGWELDKDILVKGNKVYGPDTCCFVPLKINVLFTKSNAARGNYPIGVKRSGNKFVASIGGTKSRKHLGTFSTQEEAFFAYKEAKEERIQQLAKEYKDLLDPRVYEALMKYEVEITD